MVWCRKWKEKGVQKMMVVDNMLRHPLSYHSNPPRPGYEGLGLGSGLGSAEPIAAGAIKYAASGQTDLSKQKRITEKGKKLVAS